MGGMTGWGVVDGGGGGDGDGGTFGLLEALPALSLLHVMMVLVLKRGRERATEEKVWRANVGARTGVVHFNRIDGSMGVKIRLCNVLWR